MSGFWKTMGSAFIPGTMGELDANAARERSQQQAAQLQALIGQIEKNDPQMGFLLRSNPKAVTDALAKGYEPQKLGVGEMGLPGYGGPAWQSPRASGAPAPQPARPAYNPRTGMDGGISFSIGQDGTAAYGQGRPASIAETETAANNQADNTRQQAAFDFEVDKFAQQFGLDRAKAAEIVRHNKAQEGLGARRESRIGAGGAGGNVPPPPPGFVLE